MTISIPGSLLAGLIREAASEAYCEGLIFGTVAEVQQASVTDDSETSSSSATCVVIHDFLTTGTRFSFYNTAGQLDEELIHDANKATAGLPIIGWFATRAGISVLTPSLRQAAVTKALSEARNNRGDSRPVLLISLALGDPAGSTASTDVQCFSQRQPGALALAPMALTVSNLNSHDSQLAHSSFVSMGPTAFFTETSMPAADPTLTLQRIFDATLGSFDSSLASLEEEEALNEELRAENAALEGFLAQQPPEAAQV